MQLQWAARKLSRLHRTLAGAIKAIAISGVQGDGTAMARLSGYEKGVTEAGGEFLKGEIQYADAVADKAANCMEAVKHQNHPEGIAIIVCNNDDMAMAAFGRSI